jgi:hypothetical protein
LDFLHTHRHTQTFTANPKRKKEKTKKKGPWAQTGTEGFSRLTRWGYVHRLLIQGYVPGWIRFVRQDWVCVHSDGIDSFFPYLGVSQA